MFTNYNFWFKSDEQTEQLGPASLINDNTENSKSRRQKDIIGTGFDGTLTASATVNMTPCATRVAHNLVRKTDATV